MSRFTAEQCAGFNDGHRGLFYSRHKVAMPATSCDGTKWTREAA